ncbi:hypothetical protein [Thalassotalea maritima]|uniref:hypothetical protein n=1 Tax=Thalassotalea maritima TaxID=3242416 RepID=UPI003527A792
MDKMRVELDLQKEHNGCHDTLKQLVIHKLLENKVQFNELLARTAHQICSRAHVDMASFAVTDSMFDGDVGKVKIGVQYQSYYGFEGVSKRDAIEDSWCFTMSDNKAIFDVFMPELHVVHEL